ncbi:MAG: pyrroline-5-carboxylate reductase [bacterium]|nr:pyrroline-5-carboxylate reductase [bacterium]MDE0418249.1 pyrroline-5-carboxylate reductase [bacterium]
MPVPILLLGCGKMGSAMLSGWVSRGVAADTIIVVEPDPVAAGDAHRRHGVEVAKGVPQGLGPAVVVFAVKPQIMEDVAGSLGDALDQRPLVVSIAAGKTLAWFERHLGADIPVVRTMPNTPAAIGRGITAMVANMHVTRASRGTAESLLASVGDTVWLDDESLMDAVTALSGGGPAYVFLLIETLTRAGVAHGLPEAVASRLALHTVAGAGELALQADETPAELRRNVSSPGGTTLEALGVLMAEDGLQPLFDRAVDAAARRSRELGRQ